MLAKNHDEEIRRLKQALVDLQRRYNATRHETETLISWIEHYTGADYRGICEYGLRFEREINLGENVIRAEDWF